MPAVVRIYPKPKREHQRSLRNLRSAVYTAIADQIASGMNLRIDSRIGGFQ